MNPVYIFLDMDGVLSLSSQVIESRCVFQLNRIVHDIGTDRVRIVFNTAWNCHSLDEMRIRMVAAGFAYPDTLWSQTDGTHGGGQLAREWLRDHGEVGCPYVIVDDSTNMGPSWGRIAHCSLAMGLTAAIADQAIAIARRGIQHADIEKQFAIEALRREIVRLKTRTPWLSSKERSPLIKLDQALIKVLSKDKDFLRNAAMA